MVVIFALFVTFSFGAYLLSDFNAEVQSDGETFNEEAQAFSEEHTSFYKEDLTIIFPIAFFGMLIFSLVSAFMVDVISIVWVVFALISNIFVGILGYLMNSLYTEMINEPIFSSGGRFLFHL